MESYRCPICGGRVVPRRVAVTRTKEGTTKVFPDVEAGVCTGCGEEFYDIQDVKSWEAELGEPSQHGRQK